MRPRIAFIDYFPTHYRRRLYEELARRMEVDFYFFADERERYWNRKIPLATEGDYRRIDLRRYRPFDQAVMPGVALRLRPSRYDAVVKSLNGKLMLPLVYGTAKLTGLPYVLWTGMWDHPRTSVHRFTKGLTERIYRGADAIVAYGDHVKRFVAETDGVVAEKVFVAGQAVDATRFRNLSSSNNGSQTVLFIGQFEERKGIFDLIKAFGSVESPEARLRLVGNGSLEGQIRREAAADERIEIVGYVAQEDLAAELSSARCLVLPSITTPQDKEPWGLVVNEAMHAGRPVVATDAVGAAAGGLVEDGRNGFVVPERDPEALGRALRTLVQDTALAHELGRRAQQDVERFNYETMAAAFESAVNHAVASKRR